MAIEWQLQLERLGLLLLSGLLGAAIGFEREWSGKPAGLRTHIFIALAATFFMILGRVLIEQANDSGGSNDVVADPTRIMHAVVIGISFIGAGTIIQPETRDRVAGLTTAASIWLVAAIGIGVAIGEWVLATGVTILSLIVLTLPRSLERYLGRSPNERKGRGR